MLQSDEPVRDPHVAALRFEPTQLSRARELRCLTKTALAERIGKTPSAVTQFERGTVRPDAETVARLALALSVPVGFLARKPLASSLGLEDCHFRSLRSASQYVRRQAIRIGELIHEVSLVLESEGLELPKDELSHLRRPPRSAEDIEQLAVDVRRAWGLGLGPIPRLIALIESKGVRVLPLADVCSEVDAFSMWHEGVPFIMLAMQKSASRAHFDAAHELGHLVMHEDASPANPQVEREANQFASAFLLPRESFLRECPTRWSLPVFRALKRRWHVSIQALVVRAHRLGRLSTASYRRAFAQLNRLNMRKSECDEWELERPQVLRQALALVEEELPLARIAATLALHEPHLQEILTSIAGPAGSAPS